MGKVLCFGELLLRISPDTEREWIATNAIPVFVGGAELNVGTALAKWEVPVSFCTALPGNFLGEQLLINLQEKNIDVSPVIISGNRVGIYYLPQGTEVKNAGVIYDRENSSFSQLKKKDFDWDKILEGITWFHFSAVCPAINQQIADVCEEALQVCGRKNISISVDLNYRSKLWQYGKQPNEIMPGLVKYCDVIMGNLWAAESLLGVKSIITESIGKTDDELKTAASQSMLQLHQQYPQASCIAFTFRLQNKYWAMVQQGKELAISPQHAINDVVDKVGSGDSFMAGLIYGLYHQHPLQEVVNVAAAAAFQKLFIKADSINKTIEEIKAFVKNHE